jgi:hypothetical protein
LRGRSAAAATLSMAKDAAVASTNFIMTIPLVSGQTSTFGSPEGSNRRGTPPSSHHHLARAVSTAARLNDALTELATQRKSACIKANADPFQESVARIARTWRWEADRKAVLNATSAPAVLGDRFWRTSYGLRAADFDSNFRQNIANCGTRRQSLLPQVSGNGADAGRSIHRAQAAIRQRIRSAIDLHEINKGGRATRADVAGRCAAPRPCLLGLVSSLVVAGEARRCSSHEIRRDDRMPRFAAASATGAYLENHL